MRLFVDTEFTDFIHCELISVALVADDGREFYAECSDFDRTACSEFVRAAVLPQLGQPPNRSFTRDVMRIELLAWLDQFAQEPDRSLCFDYAGDWDLLLDLLDELPTGWRALLVNAQIDLSRLEDYYRRHGGRHHALCDAHAICYAMKD